MKFSEMKTREHDEEFFQLLEIMEEIYEPWMALEFPKIKKKMQADLKAKYAAKILLAKKKGKGQEDLISVAEIGATNAKYIAPFVRKIWKEKDQQVSRVVDLFLDRKPGTTDKLPRMEQLADLMEVLKDDGFFTFVSKRFTFGENLESTESDESDKSTDLTISRQSEDLVETSDGLKKLKKKRSSTDPE